MKVWLRHHAQAMRDAVRSVRHAWGSFAFNVIVIAAVLMMPVAGLTLVENLAPLAKDTPGNPEISVFLSPTAPAGQGAVIQAELMRLVKAVDPKAKVQFIPREKALAQMKARSGIAETVSALGENPLPDAYVIRLAPLQQTADVKRVEELSARLEKLEGVDQVQLDSAWMRRLAALTGLMKLVLAVLAATLSVVVVAVTFNTVRLQAMAQSEEIDIARLFGATDGWIRRPFHYAGGFLGLCSGLLALGLVAASLPTVNERLADILNLYASEFRFAPLDWQGSLLVLGLSVALGCLGAGLSVRRELSRPRS